MRDADKRLPPGHGGVPPGLDRKDKVPPGRDPNRIPPGHDPNRPRDDDDDLPDDDAVLDEDDFPSAPDLPPNPEPDPRAGV